MTVEGQGVKGQSSQSNGTYTISSIEPGVHPYALRVNAANWKQEIRGTLIAATWDVTFFQWTETTDPRTDLAAWRKLREGNTAASGQVRQLALKYGWNGPSEMKLSEAVTAAKLGVDHFGMIARTQLPLSAGTWEFTTLSDDGIRVLADGKQIIENWAWHGPTRDAGMLTLEEDKTVELVVEHFEIDGYAVLELGISKAEPALKANPFAVCPQGHIFSSPYRKPRQGRKEWKPLATAAPKPCSPSHRYRWPRTFPSQGRSLFCPAAAPLSLTCQSRRSLGTPPQRQSTGRLCPIVNLLSAKGGRPLTRMSFPPLKARWIRAGGSLQCREASLQADDPGTKNDRSDDHRDIVYRTRKQEGEISPRDPVRPPCSIARHSSEPAAFH